MLQFKNKQTTSNKKTPNNKTKPNPKKVVLHFQYDLSVFKLKVEIPSLAFLLQVGLNKYEKRKRLLLLGIFSF